MGRHSSGAPQPPARSSPRPPARPAAGVRTRGRGRRRRIVALLLTVLVLLGAATAAGWAAVASGRVDSLWGSSPDCDPTRVRVAAAPEAAAVLRQALGGPTGPGSDRCVDVVVRAQPPAATAAASRTAPATRWPQVWVPDSSLWAAQAPGFSATKVSTLGTSPLVVATNKATAAALGWDHSPPTWAGALRGVRPVVVPDLGTDARGLTAVLALRESLGGGTVADRAVAAAALASARGGEAAPDAVADIPPDGSTAPLVPLTEQQVVRADRSRPGQHRRRLSQGWLTVARLPRAAGAGRRSHHQAAPCRRAGARRAAVEPDRDAGRGGSVPRRARHGLAGGHQEAGEACPAARRRDRSAAAAAAAVARRTQPDPGAARRVHLDAGSRRQRPEPGPGAAGRRDRRGRR